MNVPTWARRAEIPGARWHLVVDFGDGAVFTACNRRLDGQDIEGRGLALSMGLPPPAGRLCKVCDTRR